MTANDYSIEKYVSEYLKPLEKIGIIHKIRTIPEKCRILFELKEPICGHILKVIIDSEPDEDVITFFDKEISITENIKAPLRKFLCNYLSSAKQFLGDEVSNGTVSLDEYTNKYLEPLKEKGIIKNIYKANNNSIWFTMVKDIKGIIISINLIPGKSNDMISLFPNSIPYYGGITTYISNPMFNENYTENLEDRIQYAMSNLKTILDIPL